MSHVTSFHRSTVQKRNTYDARATYIIKISAHCEHTKIYFRPQTHALYIFWSTPLQSHFANICHHSHKHLSVGRFKIDIIGLHRCCKKLFAQNEIFIIYSINVKRSRTINCRSPWNNDYDRTKANSILAQPCAINRTVVCSDARFIWICTHN